MVKSNESLGLTSLGLTNLGLTNLDLTSLGLTSLDSHKSWSNKSWSWSVCSKTKKPYYKQNGQSAAAVSSHNVSMSTGRHGQNDTQQWSLDEGGWQAVM